MKDNTVTLLLVLGLFAALAFVLFRRKPTAEPRPASNGTAPYPLFGILGGTARREGQNRTPGLDVAGIINAGATAFTALGSFIRRGSRPGAGGVPDFVEGPSGTVYRSVGNSYVPYTGVAGSIDFGQPAVDTPVDTGIDFDNIINGNSAFV